MKKSNTAILALLFSTLVFWGCKNGDSNPSEGETAFNKDASYAIGMSIGMEMKDNLGNSGIAPDYDELIKGFKDSLLGKNTRFDTYQANEIIEAAFKALSDERTAVLEQDEKNFLAENSKKPGISITSSGLQYEVISKGDGPSPLYEDTVLVHYIGTLTDGTIFDSSYDRGSPAAFPLDRIIPGWTEGLQLMNVGSNYIFYIPSELGYGPNGITDPMTRSHLIPPYATLIFDVELIDIVKE